MTQCNQTEFPFEAHFSRQVVARFDGSRLTTDGGSLLLRQADRKIGLLRRLASCFRDGRQPDRVEHNLEEMLAQRIYGLALGYEDLNDHEQLRTDPLLALLAGKREIEEPLAGKSTLNRLELTPAGSPLAERYHKISYSPEAIDDLLVTLFLESHRKPPQRIVLDLDATDIPLDGQQEGRFFHGYYGHYCYLPLYIFCEDHLLCARLRPSNQDSSAGSLEEVERIVRQIRAHWPKTQILLRADSGFCREELMAWCETHGVDYVFGFARNERRAGRSPARCVRPNTSITAPGSPRGCSLSSSTGHGAAGHGRDAWWRKPNRSKGRKIRATWSRHWAKRRGRRRPSTNNSTARGARWRTASRSS